MTNRDKAIALGIAIMIANAYIMANNDFKESEHPRDESGKFTDGSASGISSDGKGENDKNIKDSIFGKSFSEYSNKPHKAIKKLLEQKTGYVPSAINREEIGDIDFVYGEAGIKGYGLAHIIEKHGEQILDKIPDIISKGNIDLSYKKLGRIYVYTEKEKAVIRLDWNMEKQNWLATAFEFDKKL